MDYDLSRIDYTICGITYPDTLKILPGPAPRAQQKVGKKDEEENLHNLDFFFTRVYLVLYIGLRCALECYSTFKKGQYL